MHRLKHVLTFVAAGAALAVASCGRDGPTEPGPESARESLTRRAVTGDSTVFGPATWTRGTGAPRTDSATFGGRDGDTLTLVLSSSAPQGLNAAVTLNGRELYASPRGRALPDTLRATARTVNTLRVWMAGKPGSTLGVVVSVRRAAGPVETRVLAAFYGSSVTGTVAAGAAEYPLGATLRYRFAPRPGFERLRVVVDGLAAPDSGTLTMNRAHWMAATADTIIVLDGTEMALSRSLRSLLTSAKVREDWVAYQAALEQAASAWGAEAERHLARMELATIDPAADLRGLIRLDSALAGMEFSLSPTEDSIGLSESWASSVVRSVSRQSISQPEIVAPRREPSQILLVNGILTSESGFRDNTRRLRDYLQADAEQRFPENAVDIANVYNPSIATMDSLFALARMCERHASMTAAYGGADLRSGYAATYFGCLAGQVLTENDFAEMLDWARRAVGYVDPNSVELNRLAKAIWGYLTISQRHVLIVGHSEGSLMTQLAIQKLKSQATFNEDSASQCIGTLSVAGVSTANWPLSSRHSRFIVAKGDLVTLLPGSLRNWRPIMEDDDTRAVDAAYARLVAEGSRREVLLPWATKSPIGIHKLERYIKTDGRIIADSLDALYRTCAVGAVRVAPSAAIVQLFGTATFKATWSALDGRDLTTWDSVQWTVNADLASVSPAGRLLAGGTVGATTLQARVRNVLGLANVTIADDSARAADEPPVVSVSTRMWTEEQAGEDYTLVCTKYGMTISASARSGAAVRSVDVYERRQDNYSEYLAVPGAPLNEEFVYQVDCVPRPQLLPGSSPPIFGWYRVVVTDAYGRITDILSSNQ